MPSDSHLLCFINRRCSHLLMVLYRVHEIRWFLKLNVLFNLAHMASDWKTSSFMWYKLISYYSLWFLELLRNVWREKLLVYLKLLWKRVLKYKNLYCKCSEVLHCWGIHGTREVPCTPVFSGFSYPRASTACTFWSGCKWWMFSV